MSITNNMSITTNARNAWDAEKIEAAKGTTYIAVIIDQSSSMSSSKEQAVAGYNQTVEDLWALSKDNDIKVSLVTFDTFVYEHLWNVPASELKKSNYDSFKPQNCTALWDGLGYTVDKLMETKLEEDDAVLIILISDGAENSSKHVNVNNLRAKIQETQESKQWTFTYMGCSLHALKEMAAATSIPIANMAAWESHNYEYTGRAMAQNAGKLGGYMRSRTMKSADGKVLTGSKNFHSENDAIAADYTTENGNGCMSNIKLSDANDFIQLCGLDSASGLTNDATGQTINKSTGEKINMKVEGGIDVFSNTNKIDLKSYGMKNLS